MEKLDHTPMLQGTLRPRDFPELDLSKRQLHVWTGLTGFEPSDREEGKWRRFTPADVLRLAVMRDLKGSTGLAITEHPKLVAFLGLNAFFADTIGIWSDAGTPCLVTDLRADHRLMRAAEVNASTLMLSNLTYCLQPLAPAIQLMALAIARGGTEAQRIAAHAIEVARERARQPQYQHVRALDFTEAGMPVHVHQHLDRR